MPASPARLAHPDLGGRRHFFDAPVVAGVTAGSAALAPSDGLVEHDLAQPDRVGRHLDALVLADELERLFQRELQMRA